MAPGRKLFKSEAERKRSRASRCSARVAHIKIVLLDIKYSGFHFGRHGFAPHGEGGAAPRTRRSDPSNTFSEDLDLRGVGDQGAVR